MLARKAGSREWKSHLVEILLTRPAEIVQKTSEVLEEHGCHVDKLKSGLYIVSILIIMHNIFVLPLLYYNCPESQINTHFT